MRVKYKNKSNLGYGLRCGHEYEVMFSQPKGMYVYEAEFTYDYTDKTEMDRTFHFASKTSIDRLFDYDDFKLE